MPTVELNPGSGVFTQASAQVLNSRVAVIGVPAEGSGWGTFGNNVGAAAELRETILATRVNNLQGIFIRAYQYPLYELSGAVSFAARTSLEWRVVAIIPPDPCPILDGFVADGPSGPSFPTYGWVPVMSPKLLLPGVPVVYRVNCAGFTAVSIEVRAGAPDVGLGEGLDQVAFSISASQ